MHAFPQHNTIRITRILPLMKEQPYHWLIQITCVSCRHILQEISSNFPVTQQLYNVKQQLYNVKQQLHVKRTR
jgi:NADH:ubiquinone oxidoreductase subunit C